MSQDTIFQEVDEELRRDRMRHGWRRFGPWVIAAAIALVLIVALNEAWNWWQNTNAARSSDQYYAAIDLENAGKLQAAQDALTKVIADGSGNYPELARFKQAGLLVRQNEPEKARAAYDAIATSATNQSLKELALLYAANLLVDKGDVAGIKSRVEGLMAPTDPLHDSALETLGLAQYKAGDLNGARDSFQAVLGDPSASNEARGRMQLYMRQLIAEGATPPPGTPAITGGTAPLAPAASKPADGNAAAPAPATGASGPAGVAPDQLSTPDSALDLAVPSAPATATSPADAAPSLSTGAGLPAVPGTEAPATGTSPAPASGPSSAPASGSASPAPATGTTGQ